jgi:3-phenylpropionate/trans-cinnamate dioxygenase ferredoxin reductase subunit
MDVDVLIAGAGQAGTQAAATLRQSGFKGSIALVSAQTEWPYELPPLSKDYLAGTRGLDAMLLRPTSFWSANGIEFIPGQAVIHVDATARRVRTDVGTEYGFTDLVWATGGEPRRLGCEGADLDGVHYIRTKTDVDRLKSELPGTQTVVIVGAGYIGLEAAAILTKLGKKAIVVEACERVLSRVAGEPLSRFFEARHRAAGVDLRLGCNVSRIVGTAGRAAGVELSSGEMIAADMIIVGIGIVPTVAPLLAAGAEGANGVNVDAYALTNLPGIYAIGDCAAHVNPFAGQKRVRLESVQNAKDQAIVAAKNILGEKVAYKAVPWFWSNQYDIRLQTVGLSLDFDDVIVRGDLANESFSLVYFRNGRIVALDCVNCVKDYVQGKALVLDGASPDRERLADTSIPLKEL